MLACRGIGEAKYARPAEKCRQAIFLSLPVLSGHGIAPGNVPGGISEAVDVLLVVERDLCTRPGR